MTIQKSKQNRAAVSAKVKVKYAESDDDIVYTFGKHELEVKCYNSTKGHYSAYIYLDRIRVAEFAIYALANFFTRKDVKGAMRGMIDQLTRSLLNREAKKGGEA